MRHLINRFISTFIMIILVCLLFSVTRGQQVQPQRDEEAKPLTKGALAPLGVGQEANPSRLSRIPGTSDTSSIQSVVADTQIPRTLVTWSTLTSGVDTEFNLLSMQEAAQLKIPALLTSVDAKSVRKVLVKNYIAYNKSTDNNGKTVYKGAGIRWVMDVATTDANAKFSFPVLAAQAQLGIAKAAVKIYTIGINNDAINAATNVPTELNVENYFKMAQGFDKARDLIVGTLQVDPQDVETTTEIKDAPDADYTKAILQSWTLARIVEKKTVKEAQDSCPIAEPSAKAMIAEIYKSRTGIVDLITKPTDVDVATAKQLLRGIKVTK